MGSFASTSCHEFLVCLRQSTVCFNVIRRIVRIWARLRNRWHWISAVGICAQKSIRMQQDLDVTNISFSQCAPQGVGCHCVGPCVTPAKLTFPQHLQFLHRHLHKLFEDVNLHAWQWMWLLRAAAPAHFSQEWLGIHYPQHSIRHGTEALVTRP